MKTLTTIETRSGCKTLRVTFTALRGLLLFLAVLAGCAVGPDYERPELNAPAAFRPAATGTNDLSATNSLADLGWWQVMNDPQLQNYITEALTNSWDIKIAAARVLQAEAAARVTAHRRGRRPAHRRG